MILLKIWELGFLNPGFCGFLSVDTYYNRPINNGPNNGPSRLLWAIVGQVPKSIS